MTQAKTKTARHANSRCRLAVEERRTIDNIRTAIVCILETFNPVVGIIYDRREPIVDRRPVSGTIRREVPLLQVFSRLMDLSHVQLENSTAIVSALVEAYANVLRKSQLLPVSQRKFRRQLALA